MQPPRRQLLVIFLIGSALFSASAPPITVAVRGRCEDGSVSLFDAKSNQLLRRLERHPGIVYAIAFSPDGKFIASGSGDKTIKFWDAQTGKLLKTLVGHTLKINSIAFSADGQTLASGSEDDTVKIWNVKSGELLRTIAGYAGVNGIKGLAFSPDGRTVIAGSGAKVRVWQTATGKLVRTLETHETHLSGDPAGVHVDVCCGSEVFSVSFSPDGRLIVSAHDDGTIKLWDLKSPTPIRIIKGQSPGLRAVALSPNGKLIAAGYNESDSLDLWSVQDGKLVMELGENARSVRSLAFSSDSRMIVSAHPSDLKLWDPKTGALLRQLWRPYSEYDQVAFSPDGKRIVAGGENQNILVWNTRTGRLLWSLIPIDR